jgi:hypothetical protein
LYLAFFAHHASQRAAQPARDASAAVFVTGASNTSHNAMIATEAKKIFMVPLPISL